MEYTQPHNEKALLIQVANGDEVAFRELFYAYRPRLIGYVLSLSKSEQAAEDIVHDIFLDVWVRRQQLPEIEQFTGWLFRAVQYRARRVLQRRAKEKLIVAELQHEADGEPRVDAKEQLTNKKVQQFIRQSIDKLTPQQRKIFLLSRHLGFSHAEIAERLGLSQQTVSNHLSEALRFLRSEVDAFHGPYAIAIFVLFNLF